MVGDGMQCPPSPLLFDPSLALAQSLRDAAEAPVDILALEDPSQPGLPPQTAPTDRGSASAHLFAPAAEPPATLPAQVPPGERAGASGGAQLPLPGLGSQRMALPGGPQPPWHSRSCSPVVWGGLGVLRGWEPLLRVWGGCQRGDVSQGGGCRLREARVLLSGGFKESCCLPGEGCCLLLLPRLAFPLPLAPPVPPAAPSGPVLPPRSPSDAVASPRAGGGGTPALELAPPGPD